ncbi:hypothetical protein HBA54_05460 [Pelagibius litoralis]|uniref:Lipoprotein n=1 Tax=Pelagibius litoralis TaxID=374515 RepID=A0A967C280_9PROT|nr:hypothetical protein [Pelagibius litoralis]NIA68033.1 hypothetical protein [Pelagibius litoralis]
MNRLLTVFAGCLFLTACAGPQINALGPSMSEIQAMPLKEAQTHLAGRTVMTFIERHREYQDSSDALGYYKWVDGPGTQVEFLAEDGRWFLWSPEGTELASGEWVLRSWYNDRYYICFSPSGAFNNVLARHAQEDEFKCVLLAEYAGQVVEARRGDAFELASGRLPFELSAEPATIDSLLKRSE